MVGNVIDQGGEYRGETVLHSRENEFDFVILDLRCQENPGANDQ